MSAQGKGGSVTAPVDVDLMRENAARLLADNAELPTAEELGTLVLMLRGHIMLVISEVQAATERLPEDDVPRACALACIGEAHMWLRLEPGGNLPAAPQLVLSIA